MSTLPSVPDQPKTVIARCSGNTSGSAKKCSGAPTGCLLRRVPRWHQRTFKQEELKLFALCWRVASVELFSETADEPTECAFLDRHVQNTVIEHGQLPARVPRPPIGQPINGPRHTGIVQLPLSGG